MKNYNEFKINESIKNADSKLSTLQSYCEDVLSNILLNGENSELKSFATEVLNITKEIKIELKNQI